MSYSGRHGTKSFTAATRGCTPLLAAIVRQSPLVSASFLRFAPKWSLAAP